jgi:hypothetical protein
MVMVLAYDTSFDLRELQYTATAVWVELDCVQPVLEIEANAMLAEVGPVLHLTIATHRSNYQKVRGCVLVNLAKELTHGLLIPDLEGNEHMIHVIYKDLPKICPVCRRRGHLPVICPQRIPPPPSRDVPMAEASPAFNHEAESQAPTKQVDSNGFQLARRRKQQSKRKPEEKKSPSKAAHIAGEILFSTGNAVDTLELDLAEEEVLKQATMTNAAEVVSTPTELTAILPGLEKPLAPEEELPTSEYGSVNESGEDSSLDDRLADVEMRELPQRIRI